MKKISGALLILGLIIAAGLLFLPIGFPVGAQVVIGSQPIQNVFVAPSGSCSSTSPVQQLVPNGTLYTCQSGTWATIGGSGSGTVSPNSGTAGAIANYAAAGGSTTVGPDSNFADVSNTLLGPNGTIAHPTYGFTNGTNYGLFFDSGNAADSFTVTGVERLAIDGNGPEIQGTGASLGYCFAGAGLFSSRTTCVQSPSAGIVSFDTTSSGNGQTKVKAAGYMSTGTQFTQDTGCGTIVTSSGGATAGKFTTVGSTGCTTVITMGNSATAPNGWQCSVSDITTLGDVGNPHMTTSNATTATIATGTIVSGDVISFSCIGY